MPQHVPEHRPARITATEGPGRSAEPLNLATDSLLQVINRLLSSIGLSDPLGVGEGSLAALPPGAVPPAPSASDPRFAELLKKFGGGSEVTPAPVLSDPQSAELLKRFGGRGLSTGTKPLREFLGEVLTPSSPQPGVPKRIRLSSIDPAEGKAITHALGKGFQQMDATTADVANLIREGKLVPEGPEELGVSDLMKKLKRIMRSVKVPRR